MRNSREPRPIFTSRRTRIILAVALAVVAGTSCGGGGSPSGSTPVAAQVTVTALPVPLLAAPEPGGPARYRITANLTLRETSGIAATITQFRVTVSVVSGQSTSVSYPVNLSVAGLGSAAYVLQTVLDLPGAPSAAKWHLETSGTGPSTTALTVAPVDSDVTFRSPVLADAVMVGAGDIARCNSQSEPTARLLDQIPGTVFTAGDNVYPYGTAQLYADCYGPTWGRHLWRTYPAPGNHDWDSGSDSAYFAYFGQAAGPVGLGYYAFTIGAWQVVSLNSNIQMGAGSAQYEWLRSTLAASTKSCTFAIWHHPLFSSGVNGGTARVRDAWRLLYQAGAEIIVNGDDHIYERFAPQNPDGGLDARGIRQFVVGTGGDVLYERKRFSANSEVFENQTWGVLKLTLKSEGYDWEFVPIQGQSFRDSGSGQCVSR